MSKSSDVPGAGEAISVGRAKLFVFGIIFLNSIGVGLLIPVVPRLVQDLTGLGPESASFENGLLLSVYAATAFLLSPFLGRLSDRFGRKPVLLLATLGTLLDYALCAVAHSFAILLIARVAAGAFGASSSVANAALADITPVESRSRTFGHSSAVFGLGLIFGPMLGGVLMDFGIRVPFIAACVLAVFEFGFGLIWFSETLHAKSQRRLSLADINPISWIRRLGKLPLSVPLLIGITLFQLGGTTANSVLVLFTQAKFGWDGAQIGVLMTTLACTSIAIRYSGVRAAICIFGEANSIVVGFGIFAIGLFALAYVNAGWELYAALIFGQCGTIAQPIIFGLLSGSVPSEAQGEVQGAISGVLSLTSMIAPLIGGMAYGRIDMHGTIFGGVLVFMLSALLVMLGVLAAAWGVRMQARGYTSASASVAGVNE